MLEETRQLHADIELSTQVITNEILNQAKVQKRKIYQDHRIADEILNIQNKSKKLLTIYQDSDQTRQKDIDSMSGFTLQKTLSNFDDRITQIKDYHDKFPHHEVNQVKREQEHKLSLVKLPIQQEQLEKVKFSAQEEFGQYLDLHSLYTEFVNMNDFSHMDYLSYVTNFYQFHKIDPKLKNEAYRTYLVHLLEYLRDFYQRSHPLSKSVEEIESEMPKPPEPEEVETEQKSRKRKRKENIGKRTFQLESLIVRYQELLEEEIDQTKLSIEKKQTRSWEENQQEIEKHDFLEMQELEKMNTKHIEKDEEEEFNSNPLNIPLGYDGKPIPYWLYRLHGLGIEYKCEICGNYSYWGPKAFEKHFQEWRHAHAMRCLKIPNTRHFQHITSIQEAIALWKKIKSEMNQGAWDKEQEEYEDKDGNVFSKKTFTDLKRQGLIKE